MSTRIVVETTIPSSHPINATEQKFQSTPEGMALAYLSIVVMALIPIFYGSFKSVKHQIYTLTKCRETGEQPEAMTGHDAAIFPFIASAGLLGFYFLMKFSPDLVNFVLSGYFFVIGICALTRLIKPVTFQIFPSRFNKTEYFVHFSSTPGPEDNKTAELSNDNTESSETETSEDESGSEAPQSSHSGQIEEVYFHNKFFNSDILAAFSSIAMGIWYISSKHWIANNLFGVAFALNGIELLHINSVKNGCILLGGLFIYDIFWVFGTDVMVSVAKKFDAPIKLVFPQDFLVRGIEGKNFAMLGLGDIVIPGFLISLFLRFDHSTKRKSNLYFWSCFIAYIIGLAICIGVMTIFKHAQPALLYLVPCCLIVPFIVAGIKGDVGALLKYRDQPDEETEKEKKAEVDKKASPKPRKSTRKVQLQDKKNI